LSGVQISLDLTRSKGSLLRARRIVSLILLACFRAQCTRAIEVHMTLVDDLQELSRADLQDLCRTHDVTVNLNGDKRALTLAAVEQGG
jgi:hypothetical protein